MKSLSLKKAADAMRKGSCLAQMHETKPDGKIGFGSHERKSAFYIVPGGRIDDNVARKLMERPDVHASQDGLFPGHSQTWRMGKLAA